MTTRKRCKKCGKIKSIKEFISDKLCVGGYAWTCKQCKQKASRERIAKSDYHIVSQEVEKECTICGFVKPIDSFGKNNQRKDGLMNQCLSCVNDRARPKARTIVIRDDLGNIIEKQCKKCKKILSLDLFYVDNRKKEKACLGGREAYCINCQKKRTREYNKTYPEKLVNHNIVGNALSKVRKAQRLSKGLCSVCNTPKLEHSPYCIRHWVSTIASGTMKDIKLSPLLLKKLEEQDFKCPYTKATLIPGINCWLDHIKPKSLYPELIRDMNNVEWVLKEVNVGKGIMSKESYLRLCKMVTNVAELGEQENINE